MIERFPARASHDVMWKLWAKKERWLIESFFWGGDGLCMCVLPFPPLQAASCTRRTIEKNKKTMLWRMRGSCSTTSRARPSHKTALGLGIRQKHQQSTQKTTMATTWRHQSLGIVFSPMSQIWLVGLNMTCWTESATDGLSDRQMFTHSTNIQKELKMREGPLKFGCPQTINQY